MQCPAGAPVLVLDGTFEFGLPSLAALIDPAFRRTMADVVRLQTFLVSADDIPAFMKARQELFPAYFPTGLYPPNTLLVVSRLVRPELRVEVEAMAVRRAPRPVGRKRPAGVTRSYKRR